MPLLKDDARFADCRTRNLKSCGAHTISIIFVKFVRLSIIDMAKTFPFLKDFRNGIAAEGPYNLLNLDDLNKVTDSPGVYIIEAADKFRFPYPKGNSSILYIGMSDSSLRGRLKRHRLHLKELCDTNGQHGMADNEEWVCQRYQYMYYHGAKVYYYSRKGKQEAKNLEAEILWQFYAKYRALPVGNGAKSYSKPK